MIPQGSRYEQADRAFTPAHVYDEFELPRPDPEETPGALQLMVTHRDALYLVTTLPLPPPPPAEYYAKEDEHFPFLSYKFLEDSREWWRIAEVNPQVWYPLDLRPGNLIRIPTQ